VCVAPHSSLLIEVHERAEPFLRALGKELRVAATEREAQALCERRNVSNDVFVEIPADDTASDIAEDRHRDWIDRAYLEFRIDEINAERSLVDQRLELLGAVAQRDLSLPAFEIIRRLPHEEVHEMQIARGRLARFAEMRGDHAEHLPRA